MIVVSDFSVGVTKPDMQWSIQFMWEGFYLEEAGMPSMLCIAFMNPQPKSPQLYVVA